MQNLICSGWTFFCLLNPSLFEKCAHFYWPHSFFSVYFKRSSCILIFDFFLFLSYYLTTFTNSQSSPKPKKTTLLNMSKSNHYCMICTPHLYNIVCAPTLLVDRGTKLCEYYPSSYHLHTTHFLENQVHFASPRLFKIKADICLSTLLSWTCKIHCAWIASWYHYVVNFHAN